MRGILPLSKNLQPEFPLNLKERAYYSDLIKKSEKKTHRSQGQRGRFTNVLGLLEEYDREKRELEKETKR